MVLDLAPELAVGQEALPNALVLDRLLATNAAYLERVRRQVEQYLARERVVLGVQRLELVQ